MPGSLGIWIGGDLDGCERRLVLFANSFGKCDHNRSILIVLGCGARTPRSAQAFDRRLMVRFWRSAGTTDWRMDPLRFSAPPIWAARYICYDRRTRATPGSDSIRRGLRGIRRRAFRLRSVYCENGTGVASWPDRVRVSYRSLSRRGGLRPCIWDTSPHGGDSGGHNDKPFWCFGLVTQFFRASHAGVGAFCPNSMVGDLPDLSACGIGMDRSCIAAKRPMGIRGDGTRRFGCAGQLVLE